jgi:hypothetical protein
MRSKNAKSRPSILGAAVLILSCFVVLLSKPGSHRQAQSRVSADVLHAPRHNTRHECLPPFVYVPMSTLLSQAGIYVNIA